MRSPSQKAQSAGNLRTASVHLAVLTAIAAAGAARAQQAPPSDSSTASLQEVVVTGSRIRRVDTETASPVLTIDPALIQGSGAQTIGDLAMMLPTVNGSATNPATNNGGGFGESYLELRGLDAKRTLILIDGRRVGLIGDPSSNTSAVDVNQIPLSIIDHVEVLKEGAGAVYGSDAIAGVINFVTRKDIDGMEVSADYGRTTEADGAHRQLNLSFGQHTDKYDFMITGRYQHQDSVLQSQRSFTKFALYNSSNSIYNGGSSRTPTGRIYVPDDGSAFATQFGSCDSGSVTKIAGTQGTSLANYRCFNSGGTNDDHYNFAPANYLETPQERGSIFSNFNYKINDDVSAYASVLYNRTHSGFQEAALPFDSVLDNVVISQYSMYNPFGVSFGGNAGVNAEAEWRLLGAGPRRSDTSTNTMDANFGLKGNLFSTGWTWDLYSQYGRLDQTQRVDGYFFANGLSAATGPSMLVNGTPTCVGTPGDPASAISGCIPINIFAVNDPSSTSAAQQAAFASIAADYNTNYTYRTRSFAFDVQGKVFSAPGGDALLDVGTEYREQEGIFQVDNIVQATAPLYLGCAISQEACTSNSDGHYSNKDIFGELFVPILKDLPGVHSLNADIGIRWSDYTISGSTTRATFKLEYRPIQDLLLRGTYAQIYRAPTILDTAAGPRITSAQFTDPCNGLTAAKVAASANLAKACQGVTLNGTFAEGDAQITGLLLSNPDLKPETGSVETGGFVFEPSFLPGFSADFDYWNYTINNVIDQLDPNYSSQQCLLTGQAFFCDLNHRYTSGAQSGQIIEFLQPTTNLGTLKTDGIDIGTRYQLRNTPIGSFKFDVEVTHVMSYTKEVAGLSTQYAGQYSLQYGNDTKWRGLASLQWSWLGVDTLVTEQFIDKIILPDGSPGSTNTVVKVPSIWYTNMSVGYTFSPTKTHIQAGIDNVFNRNPPILYQNNVQNANTDVATYDVLGRRWFVSFTQKF